MDSKKSRQRRGQATRDASPTPSIPLVCMICPNPPGKTASATSGYSDISHLLTHVSSKGHLANLYRKQLARDHDEEARTALEQYNSWYQRYGIEDLVKTRSLARGQRVQQRSRRGQSMAGSGGLTQNRGNNNQVQGNSNLRTTYIGTQPPALMDQGQGNNNLRTATQPPALMDGIKSEPQTNMSDFTPFSQLTRGPEPGPEPFRLERSHGHQSFVQQRYYHHPMTYSTMDQQVPFAGQNIGAMGRPTFLGAFGRGVEPKLEPEADDSDEENSSKYEPSDDEDSQDNQNGADSSRRSETPDETMNSSSETNNTSRKARETAQLAEEAHNAKFKKGEWLEGMHVFDAASEEERKRRNQKKPPHVLESMIRHSKTITRDELVMDLNLDYQRTRDVFATPSDDGIMSEDEAESSKTKRRKVTNKGGRGRTNKTRARSSLIGNDSRESSVASTTISTVVPTRSTRVTRASTRAARGQKVDRSRTRFQSQASIKVEQHTRATSFKLEPDSQVDLPDPNDDGSSGGDVFRDAEADASREGRPGSPRGQLRLPSLALRPGNHNRSLLSPTPVLKRNTPRLYDGKENNLLPFTPQTKSTTHPYFSSHSPMGASSFNPLCLRRRDDVGSGYRVYQSFDENSKPAPTTGFQPINGNTGYDPLHFGNAYQPTHHHNADFDI